MNLKFQVLLCARRYALYLLKTVFTIVMDLRNMFLNGISPLFFLFSLSLLSFPYFSSLATNKYHAKNYYIFKSSFMCEKILRPNILCTLMKGFLQKNLNKKKNKRPHIFFRFQDMPFAITQHTHNETLCPMFVIGFSREFASRNSKFGTKKEIPSVGSAVLPFFIGVEATLWEERKEVENIAPYSIHTASIPYIITFYCARHNMDKQSFCRQP